MEPSASRTPHSHPNTPRWAYHSASTRNWISNQYRPEDKNAWGRGSRLENLGFQSSMRKPCKLWKQGMSLKNCTLFVKFREELVICRLPCNPWLWCAREQPKAAAPLTALTVLLTGVIPKANKSRWGRTVKSCVQRYRGYSGSVLTGVPKSIVVRGFHQSLPANATFWNGWQILT
jgi:hypothetical protein